MSFGCPRHPSSFPRYPPSDIPNQGVLCPGKVSVKITIHQEYRCASEGRNNDKDGIAAMSLTKETAQRATGCLIKTYIALGSLVLNVTNDVALLLALQENFWNDIGITYLLS